MNNIVTYVIHTMDDICDRIGSMGIDEEFILNTVDYINEYKDIDGVFCEIITNHNIYRVYSDGRLYVVNNSGKCILCNCQIVVNVVNHNKYKLTIIQKDVA